MFKTQRLALISMVTVVASILLVGCLGRGDSSGAVAPLILVQPANQTVTVGNIANFLVYATSASPVTYQWNRNGIPIIGATSFTFSTYTDSNDNSSWFSVTITNAFGSITSKNATVTVSGVAPNGTTLRPIMGWSSWSSIRGNPSESVIKAQADQIAAKLASHGYLYVNMDDDWYLDPNATVDQYGYWMPDNVKFPSGMKALGDYLHGKGLKFGMYVTPGIPRAAVIQNSPIKGTNYHAKDIADLSKYEYNYNLTYSTSQMMYYIDFTKPGSQEFITSWASLFASWGVDFIKLDGVDSFNIPDIQAWSYGLNHSGRPIHLALSGTHSLDFATTYQKYANSWRTGADIETYSSALTDWAHVLSRFNQAAAWAPYNGPGGWMDLDSIDVTDGTHDGLNNDEKQTYVTLWAMTCSEFYTGGDLTNTDEYGLSLLTNDDVISINQCGLTAIPINPGTLQPVWYKKMGDGTYVVALFNLTDSISSVTVNFKDCGFSGSGTVLDVWMGVNLGIANGSFTAPALNPHASQLIRVVNLH